MNKKEVTYQNSSVSGTGFFINFYLWRREWHYLYSHLYEKRIL